MLSLCAGEQHSRRVTSFDHVTNAPGRARTGRARADADSTSCRSSCSLIASFSAKNNSHEDRRPADRHHRGVFTIGGASVQSLDVTARSGEHRLRFPAGQALPARVPFPTTSKPFAPGRGADASPRRIDELLEYVIRPRRLSRALAVAASRSANSGGSARACAERRTTAAMLIDGHSSTLDRSHAHKLRHRLPAHPARAAPATFGAVARHRRGDPAATAWQPCATGIPRPVQRPADPARPATSWSRTSSARIGHENCVGCTGRRLVLAPLDGAEQPQLPAGPRFRTRSAASITTGSRSLVVVGNRWACSPSTPLPRSRRHTSSQGGP